MTDHEYTRGLLVHSYENGESPSVYLDSRILCSLIDNDSTDLRIWLARALAYHDSGDTAVTLLRKLSNDKEPCVRVEAIDSLSAFACQESFDVLCNASCDGDELVRAYSAFGIALVGRSVAQQKALNYLLNMVETEHSNRVLVNIYEGLYLLGKKEALRDLICLFNSTDYHVQCAVLHALEEILCSGNKAEIKQFVDSLDASIYVHAVADTIKQLSAKCQQ